MENHDGFSPTRSVGNYVHLALNLRLPGESWKNTAFFLIPRCLQQWPGVWDPWFGRGFAHSGLQQWDKALADYSEAIKLAPEVHAPWHHRAGLYSHLRRWDNAAADYSKLLEKYPNDVNACYWRGVAYANLKQPEKAIADLRKAIDKGFGDVNHMKKDPVLDPLRNREDFKKLLAGLVAKTKT